MLLSHTTTYYIFYQYYLLTSTTTYYIFYQYYLLTLPSTHRLRATSGFDEVANALLSFSNQTVMFPLYKKKSGMGGGRSVVKKIPRF